MHIWNPIFIIKQEKTVENEKSREKSEIYYEPNPWEIFHFYQTFSSFTSIAKNVYTNQKYIKKKSFKQKKNRREKLLKENLNFTSLHVC